MKCDFSLTGDYEARRGSAPRRVRAVGAPGTRQAINIKTQDPFRLVLIACFVPRDGRDAAVELDDDRTALRRFSASTAEASDSPLREWSPACSSI